MVVRVLVCFMFPFCCMVSAASAHTTPIIVASFVFCFYFITLFSSVLPSIHVCWFPLLCTVRKCKEEIVYVVALVTSIVVIDILMCCVVHTIRAFKVCISLLQTAEGNNGRLFRIIIYLCKCFFILCLLNLLGQLLHMTTFLMAEMNFSPLHSSICDSLSHWWSWWLCLMFSITGMLFLKTNIAIHVIQKRITALSGGKGPQVEGSTFTQVYMVHKYFCPNS